MLERTSLKVFRTTKEFLSLFLIPKNQQKDNEENRPTNGER